MDETDHDLDDCPDPESPSSAADKNETETGQTPDQAEPLVYTRTIAVFEHELTGPGLEYQLHRAGQELRWEWLATQKNRPSTGAVWKLTVEMEPYVVAGQDADEKGREDTT